MDRLLHTAVALVLGAGLAAPTRAWAGTESDAEGSSYNSADADARPASSKTKKKKKKPRRRRRSRSKKKAAAEAEVPEVVEVPPEPTTEEKIAAAVGEARTRRAELHERAQELMADGKTSTAVEELAAGASRHQDPVLYLDAAEVVYKSAPKRGRKRVKSLELGLEHNKHAELVLDELPDPEAEPDKQVIAPSEREVIRAKTEARITANRSEIDTLNKRSSAIGLLAGGGVLLAAGIVGFSVMGAGIVREADRQRVLGEIALRDDADQIDLTQIEEEGRRTAAMRTAGAIMGSVGIAVAPVLLAVGGRRLARANKAREQAGKAYARVRPTTRGIMINGRF